MDKGGYYANLQSRLSREKQVLSAPLSTAKELNQLIERRQREKDSAFREILDMCMKRVRKCAFNRQYRCVFEVPEFVLGVPLYDVNDAIKFVIRALKEDCGMHVRYFFPRLLYISWHYDEINGKVVMMPLMAEPGAAHPEQHIALPAPSRGDVDEPSARPSFRPPAPPNPYLLGGGFIPPPALSRQPPISRDDAAKKTSANDPGGRLHAGGGGGGGGGSARGGRGGRGAGSGRRGGTVQRNGAAVRSIDEFKPTNRFVSMD